MSESIEDILQRLAKLETEVAQLSAKLKTQEAPPPQVAPPRPAAPRPMPPPRPIPQMPPPTPREPRNPMVIVAAVGAGFFLLGSVFTLHLAIQKGWIGPEMRFLLGLVVGAALSAGAAKMILGDSRKVGACLLLAGLGTLVFSLRVGAFNYHFFPPVLGLAGTALSTLAAGGLAARSRFSPVMGLAVVLGLLAPLVFSQGGHHEIALTVYLMVLGAASLAVPYLAQVGGRWGVVRWLLAGGTWFLLGICCGEVLVQDAPVLLGLLLVHLLLTGLWIWQPRREELPSTPVVMWFLLNITFCTLLWVLWLKLNWIREGFTAPVMLLAALNLALVKPIRERLESHRGDLGQMVLVAGFLALAVPVALDWAWVGPLWGVFALGLAWALGYTREHPDWGEEEVFAMRLLAIGMALLATGTWLVHLALLYDSSQLRLPFLNRHFLEGALASLAWLLLIRDEPRGSRLMGFLGVQSVGALTLAFEFAHLVRYAGGSNRAASIVITVVWTLLGAGQWLRSLGLEEDEVRRPIAIAGYVWLALASAKLILVDLSAADTLLRALAFLAVGAVFLGAALVANQFRRKLKETE